MEDLIPWPYALFIAAAFMIAVKIFSNMDMLAVYMFLVPPVLLLLLIIYGESYRKEVEKK
jgi:hypothetical protein